MRITFFSNFINHHQIPLANELYSMPEVDYTFVAMEAIPEERLSMGYVDQNKSFPYVLTTYDSAENLCRARELAIESDIVIIGSAPDSIMLERLPTGKLTFHSSERYFKKGITWRYFPENFASAMKHIKRFERYRNYNYLCMSAYAAADINMFANYEGRMFQWAYFTDVKSLDVKNFLKQKSYGEKVSILWAGRLLSWKHPEDCIYIAKYLQSKGYTFELNIIGNGELEHYLKNEIYKEHLEEKINMVGALSPDSVRQYMERADIFLFTSDYNEGWGAVLNEAMSSGCAVVASHAAGATPYLIKHNMNGLIYKCGEREDLFLQVEALVENYELRKKIMKNAVKTMQQDWNAKSAANRLFQLCQKLQRGEESPFESGPCSVALPIAQEKMYAYLMKSTV